MKKHIIRVSIKESVPTQYQAIPAACDCNHANLQVFLPNQASAAQ